MKARFIHDGKAVDFFSETNVAAGTVIVEGDLVGVTKLDIQAGRLGALHVVGVFDVAKGDSAISLGAKVYWDNTAKQAVTTATGNKLLGLAVLPAAASVGELCVFRLSDAKTYADWCIVPEATCYIDSSGSSLAFASNNRATYTILAAIVEDGIPKILTHICEYGFEPQPDPSPTPNPDPTPKPNPPPNLSIQEWVTQNVPEAGWHQCAALASCYEATANAIESGSILTQAAAFSTIRTASQTKIDVEIWSEFLEALSTKVNTALTGNTDVKKLGSIFREIAAGLKAVSDTPKGDTGPEVSAPERTLRREVNFSDDNFESSRADAIRRPCRVRAGRFAINAKA